MNEYLGVTGNELNTILKICINKNITIKRDKKFYNNILELFPKGKNVGVANQNKYNFIRALLKMCAKGNSVEHAMSSVISANPNYQTDLHDIDFLYSEECSSVIQERLLNVLDFKLKEKEMQKTNEAILNYAEKIKGGETYDSVEEMWEDHENTCNDILFNFRESRKNILESKSTIIRFGKDLDAHKRLVKQMKEECDKTKRIPTGIKFLDEAIRGGLEKATLTTFGGASGSGKSTVLVNMFHYAGLIHEYKGQAKDQHKIFYYLSVENPHKLTYERLNSIMFDVTLDKSEEMLQKEEGLFNEEYFLGLTKKRNREIVIDHGPGQSVSLLDIDVTLEHLLDEARSEGIENPVIGAVYIDYMNRLKPRKSNSQRYRDFDDYTNDMKNIALKYNCPVVTATQLNRSASTVKTAKDLDGSGQASESSFPYQNSDTYITMKLNKDEENRRLMMKLDKGRNCLDGLYWEFDVEYEKCKIVKDFDLLKVDDSSVSSDFKFEYREEKKSFSFGDDCLF